jgi:hypothetical protein
VERRMQPSEGLVPCRVCWAYITLQPERVDIVEARVYYRCQRCGGTTMVRYQDAADLGLLDMKNSASRTQTDPDTRPPG